MPLTPRKFYTQHAREHAEKHTIDDVPPKFRELLDAFTKETLGDRILDAGCGAGRDTEYFVGQGFDPVGVDIAPGMIEYAVSNRPGEYMLMDFRDLGFAPEVFDGIWAPASIFFHPPEEMGEALDEFHRVLDADGVARVGFKIGNGTDVKHEWGDAVVQHPVHEETATELVAEAGFNIRDKRLMQPVPGKTFVNFLLSK